MTEETKPIKLGVYEAIKNVMADMSKVGIAKEQKNVSQGFKFRGIDDVYNALSPALARHHLVMLPFIQERQVTERPTRNGGVMLHVVLVVDYTFVCSTDGSFHTVRAYGEAMDSGDKATNKALAAAYKYMCFQAFCIPIQGQGEDADAETHEIMSVDEAKLGALISVLQMVENRADMDSFKEKNKEMIDGLTAEERVRFVKAHKDHVESLKSKAPKAA
jgi:hypothetical protein